MKKLYAVLSVLILASFALAACGPAATPEAFRVGFVTDTGGIDDKSFNTTQWNGILRAIEELGIEAQYIQSDEATQYEPNITEFASQGYDLTIASGFFLGGDLAKVAALYPDSSFSIVDYTYPDPFSVPEGTVGHTECIPNVQGQIFKTDQAAFLAGYLAAGMTQTGKIGYFGGAKIPTVTIFGVGFQTGMEHYNEVHGTNVELIGWDNATGEGLFTGDFMDLTKGKEATESLFDEGADIFIPVGGLIGSPGFDVARERGGWGIWVDVDGYNLLPEARDVLLTSVMKNMDNSVFDVIKGAKEGNFDGCGVYIGSLENGGVGIAPYHDLEGSVPGTLKQEIIELTQKIISGEISDTGCISYPEHCPGGLY
jgi:basic membrane protein A